MPKRSPNPRLVKIHRNYTYDEAADLLGLHKNSVRRWVTHEGLAALTEQRPHLILGAGLKAFLEHRRVKNRT